MRYRMTEWKLLAPYILSGMLSTLPLCAGDAPTASPREALMLRRITEYWKDGDFPSVKKQVTHFLEENPTTELRDHLNAMLGDLYFQEKNFRQALASYNLIGSSPIREKTFFNHLQAEFEVKNYPLVIEKAENYLGSNSSRNTDRMIKVRYLLAEACFRQALKANDQEEKTRFLKLAKPHYKVLSQTKYSERVLFPLAEIHRLLKEDDRAISLLKQLADKYPEHRERFLFQTGILQISSNKREALSTFSSVYDMGGKRGKLAAFNKLILLYQLGMHEEYLSFCEQVINLMPDQKVPILQFYEGRSHYELGDYEKAVFPLETFIGASQGRSREVRTAYLILVNCSRFTKNLPLLERTLYSFKTHFPKDSDVPQVLVVHAQLARENGDFAQALTDLKILLDDYKGYRDIEGVSYDYALLHAHTDQWAEGRRLFAQFLDQYPESSKRVAAYRHLLNCSIEEIKYPGSADTREVKEQFITSLHRALGTNGVFSPEEKEKYSLILTKCLCELNRHTEALPTLAHILKTSGNPELLGEAHLLTAIAYQKIDGNLDLFIEHGEKALERFPQMSEKELLHLELFNACLTQSNQERAEKLQKLLLSRGAEHLYLSGGWKSGGVKLENFLWLCNHFYLESLGGNEKAFSRAEELYSSLLGVSEETGTLQITPDTLYLENETLKFAYLLEREGCMGERIALLEKLVKKQESTSHLPWKTTRRTYLELARAYEQGGKEQEALEVYQSLVQTSGHISSVVNSTALLNKTNLEYRLLPIEKKKGDSHEVIAILHSLKDLQIQKRLPAEPIHLEAALRYAEIRSSLAGKTSDILFFYQRMYDDYQAKEDPIAEEYHSLRASHPEKNSLFAAYMTYLDVKMLQCRAVLARDEDKKSKGAEYEEKALVLLNSIDGRESIVGPYLAKRIEQTRALLIGK